MSAQEISLALRTAAGHERAALQAESAGAKQYEMKMRSAGASVYAAFVLAAKAAPEYQGRKIDDAAVKRIYQSTKARPWWDRHLQSIKGADREWGKRLIQWHLDPEGARARRAQQLASSAASMKRLRAQRDTTTRGSTLYPKQPAPPRTEEMRAVSEAAQTTALAGRELPRVENSAPEVTMDDLLGEMVRIRSAVQKVAAEDHGAVLEVLKTTAREVERYVP